MLPLRIVVACILFVTGLMLAGMALLKGQPIYAIGWVFCGSVVGGMFYLDAWDSIGIEGYMSLAGIATILGIWGVASYSNLFNPKLQQGYAAVLMPFAEIDLYCPHGSPELRRVSEYGVMACGMQANSDALGATAEMQKSLHLGPGLSLLDGVASLSDKEEVNHCARAFKEAVRLCPVAFSALGDKEREALLAAAK